MKTSNKILVGAGILPVLLILVMMIMLRVEFKHYMDENSVVSDSASVSDSIHQEADAENMNVE